MVQFLSTVYYLIFASICTFFIHRISNYYQKREKSTSRCKLKVGFLELYCIILIIFVVFFCSFRVINSDDSINIGGTDSFAYMSQFMDSTGTIIEQLSRFYGWEPLHSISLWIVRSFTDNYTVYLVLYYICMSLFLIKYAKMFTLNKRWIIATFALMCFFLESFNTQRNTFAVFAAFFVYDALIKKKYLKALFISLLITCIHFSGVILFFVCGILIFAKHSRLDLKIVTFFYVIFSVVVSFVVVQFIPFLIKNNRLNYYSENEMNISIPMLLTFMFVVMVFVLFCNDFDYNTNACSSLYISFAPMFIFQFYYSITYRMMLYSIPLLYVLLSYYKDYFRNKNVSYFILYFICTMLILFRITVFILGKNRDIGLYCNVFFS